MRPLFFFIAILALSISCVSKKKFLLEVEQKEGFNNTATNLAATLQQAQSKNQLLELNNTRLSDSLSKLQFALAEVNRRNENLQSQTNILTEEVVALKQRYEISLQEQQISTEKRDQFFLEMQKETQWKQQVVKELFAKLEAALQPFSSAVTLKREDLQIYLEANNSFLFTNNRLNKSGIDLLNAIGETLQKQPLVDVWIIGHTEKAGSKSTDTWDVAYQHANLVSKHLFKDITTANIFIVSKGDSSPIANNETKAGKALNNRITFRIQPRLDDMFRMKMN